MPNDIYKWKIMVEDLDNECPSITKFIGSVEDALNAVKMVYIYDKSVRLFLINDDQHDTEIDFNNTFI